MQPAGPIKPHTAVPVFTQQGSVSPLKNCELAANGLVQVAVPHAITLVAGGGTGVAGGGTGVAGGGTDAAPATGIAGVTGGLPGGTGGAGVVGGTLPGAGFETGPTEHPS